MSKHPVEVGRDRYGFAIKPGQKVEQEQKVKKVPKQKTWDSFLKKISNDFSKLENSKGLRDLIRSEGIPTEIRGKVWLAITKAGQKKGSMSYVQLLETFKGQESDHTKQIEKDLRRTFPDNAVFESEEGISALRRVLVAYSWTNPEIGYCQSMNFICALFLLFMDEEESFWLLKTTMEEILPTDYYTQGMIGVRTDERVFKELLAQKLPKISQHLSKYEIVLSGFVTAWFMSLYINILPLESALRVFDSLFYEGSKVLLRIALALFKINEKIILKEKSFEGLYNLLKDLARTAADSNKLLEVAFNRDWLGALKKESILTIRNNVWDNLRTEYLIDRENQSILHFKVEGEDIQKLHGDPMELLQESGLCSNDKAPKQTENKSSEDSPRNEKQTSSNSNAGSGPSNESDQPKKKRPVPPRTTLPSKVSTPIGSPTVNKFNRPVKPNLNPPTSPPIPSPNSSPSSITNNVNQPSPKHRSNPPGKRKLSKGTIHSLSSPPGSSTKPFGNDGKSPNNNHLTGSPLTVNRLLNSDPNDDTHSNNSDPNPSVRRKPPTNASRKVKSPNSDHPITPSNRPPLNKPPNMSVVRYDKQGEVVHRQAAPSRHHQALHSSSSSIKQQSFNISPDPLPNDDYKISEPIETTDYTAACKALTSLSHPNDPQMIHQVPKDDHAAVVHKQLNQATIRAKNFQSPQPKANILADLPPPSNSTQRLSPNNGINSRRSFMDQGNNPNAGARPAQPRMSVQVPLSKTFDASNSQSRTSFLSTGEDSNIKINSSHSPENIDVNSIQKLTETVKVLDEEPPTTIQETTITSPRNNQTITEIFTVTPAPIQVNGPSRAPSTRNFNERITLVDSRFEERFRPLSVFVNSSFNMIELMCEQEQKLNHPSPPLGNASSRISVSTRPVLYDHVIVGDDDPPFSSPPSGGSDGYRKSTMVVTTASMYVDSTIHQPIKHDSPPTSPNHRANLDRLKSNQDPQSRGPPNQQLRKNISSSNSAMNKGEQSSNSHQARVDQFRSALLKTNPSPSRPITPDTAGLKARQHDQAGQLQRGTNQFDPQRARPNHAKLDPPRINQNRANDQPVTNAANAQSNSNSPTTSRDGSTFPAYGVKKPPLPTTPPSRPLSRKVIV